MLQKQINYYDEFLMATARGTKPSDVVGQKPALVKKLADDIDFELYVGDSGEGKNTWATAIIAVKLNGGTYRWKYDGGRIFEGIEEMAQVCLDNIHLSWDLDMWRKYAQEEYEKSFTFWDRIKMSLGSVK